VTRGLLSAREHARLYAMCEALGKEAYIEGPAVAWLWRVHKSARRLVEFTTKVIARVDRRWHT
jgi:hypothetical protein